MATSKGLVLPDDDYVEMSAAELEYDGGSQQAEAEAQAQGQQQRGDSTSFKDIALGLAPSVGQLAMMYFMFGGRGAAAPAQAATTGPKMRATSGPSKVNDVVPKNNIVPNNNIIPNDINDCSICHKGMCEHM